MSRIEAVDNDLNALATALYVATDDYLTAHPELPPAPAAVRDPAPDQRL